MNALSIIRAVAWRTLRHSLTDPTIAAPAIIAPLFMLVAFTGSMSALTILPGFSFGGNYAAFLFVFVLYHAATFNGSAVGFTIARDFETRFIRRLFLATSNRRAIVFGLALASLLQGILVMSIAAVIGLLLGMNVRGQFIDIVGLICLALLLNLLACFWGCTLGLRFRSSDGSMLAGSTFMTLLFMAPVFVPITLLVGFVQSVARVNPFTPLLATGRGLIAGTPTGIPEAFGLAITICLLMMGLAFISLRGATRHV